MHRAENITAIILAGGKSSRMGTDKGLVKYRGKDMIQWSIDLLKPLFREILIIANSPDYLKFNLPVYEDLLKERGPMGGIFTALTYSDTPWNFIMACDMPFMTTTVIERLVTSCDNHDAVVPFHQGQPEPMCACYNKSSLPVIDKQIAGGNYKLQDLVSLLNVKVMDFTPEYLSDENPFRNINTMEELNKTGGT